MGWAGSRCGEYACRSLAIARFLVTGPIASSSSIMSRRGIVPLTHPGCWSTSRVALGAAASLSAPRKQPQRIPCSHSKNAAAPGRTGRSLLAEAEAAQGCTVRRRRALDVRFHFT